MNADKKYLAIDIETEAQDITLLKDGIKGTKKKIPKEYICYVDTIIDLAYKLGEHDGNKRAIELIHGSSKRPNDSRRSDMELRMDGVYNTCLVLAGNNDNSFTKGQIAKMSHIPTRTLSYVLKALCEEDKLTRIDRGIYKLYSPSEDEGEFADDTEE